MFEKLSSKEQKILGFLRDYSLANGESPTLEEIKNHFGYESLTSVQRAIVSLEKKDYISRDRYRKRSISVKQDEGSQVVPIPVVGMVACGLPILAIENIESYLPTDIRFISGDPKNYFYLHASGDSMDKAGINDGDLVLIKNQHVPDKENQIVLALIGDQATLKRVKKGEGYIALMPDSNNSEHKPIILQEDFTIQGIFVKSFQL